VEKEGYQIGKRGGVRNVLKPAQIEGIIEAYENGMDVRETAEKLGVAETSVRKYIQIRRQEGIKI